MKIQSRVVNESRWRIKVKNNQYKKVVKATRVKKRPSPKRGFVPKKQRPPELRISANQAHFLPPMLEGPLPN